MKGLAYSIIQIFTLLLTGVLVMAMYFIPPSQIIQLAPALQANQIETRATLLANSFQANPSLIYSINSVNYRGVFDSDKLNQNMIEKSSNYDNMLTCPPGSSVCGQMKSDPDTFGLILILDTQNQKGWFVVLQSDSVSDKIKSCLQSVDKSKINSLFTQDSDLVGILNLNKCGFTVYSNFANRGYPITIWYSLDNGKHMGTLRVLAAQYKVS